MMMTRTGARSRLFLSRMAFLSMVLCLSPGIAWGQASPADQKAKDSYSLGYEFGSNARKQPVGFDLDAIIAGVRDAYEGNDARYSEKEMKEVLTTLKKKVWTAQQLKYRELADKSLKEGEALLAENAKKPGITSLPSGLQYKVIQEGAGPRPVLTDRVKVQYRGTLVNGSEFDSSFSRGGPVSLGVSGVVRGWTEALQLMPVGSKWQVFIPAKLAYGNRAHGRIPPQSALIFEIELLAIEKPDEQARRSRPGSSDQEEPPPLQGEPDSQDADDQ